MTNAEIIETVRDRLIKTYNPKMIYLFGSFDGGSRMSRVIWIYLLWLKVLMKGFIRGEYGGPGHSGV